MCIHRQFVPCHNNHHPPIQRPHSLAEITTTTTYLPTCPPALVHRLARRQITGGGQQAVGWNNKTAGWFMNGWEGMGIKMGMDGAGLHCIALHCIALAASVLLCLAMRRIYPLSFLGRETPM